MKIKSKKSTTKLVGLLVVVSILVAILLSAWLLSYKAATPKSKKQTAQTHTEKPVVETFNKTRYSTTDPESVWIIVNKSHALSPTGFQPSDLTSIYGQRVSAKMSADLEKMISAAKTQGISLRIISGYRSYAYQKTLYNSYVNKDGQTAADRYSARPGHSEHQTGLAVDIGGAHGCSLEKCFGQTPEGIWLAQHASEFGFLVRYTQNNQAITGYDAEPWHLRYVGAELAKELQRTNSGTLEEFFNVSGGEKYVN